jgi:HAD superfamily hydrolase (TIGR01509 family)
VRATPPSDLAARRGRVQLLVADLAEIAAAPRLACTRDFVHPEARALAERRPCGKSRPEPAPAERDGDGRGVLRERAIVLCALIFDVDGTLADTERDGHRVAYNAAFAEAGLDWDWTPALYGELLAVAGGKERIRRYLEGWHPGFAPPSDLDAFIAGLHAIKTRHYTRLLRTGAIPLRCGVRRLLEEARSAGLRLAIATTTTPANVDALIETALGAGTWFDAVGAGDVVPAKKPAPDIYRHVLECLGLEPGQCIAFEDSENGVRSALAAELACIVTVNDYTRGQDFAGACAVLEGFGEPGRPARVLAGPSAGAALVLDVARVRALHARECDGPAARRTDRG